MSDKEHRIKMAQIVAYANHPDMRRFPAENHIAVRKEMKRNFRNLKEVYADAIGMIDVEDRKIPFELPRM